MAEEKQEITPLKKVAILLLYLESYIPNITNAIFDHLGKKHTKVILRVMADLGKIESTVIREVINEFFDLIEKPNSLYGAKNISSKLMLSNLGEQEPEPEVTDGEKEDPFAFLADVDDDQLQKLIQSETPQFAGFLFKFLSQERAAELLGGMDDETGKQIIEAVLNTQITSPKMAEKFAKRLQDRLVEPKDGELSDEEKLVRVSRVLEMVQSTKRSTLLDLIRQDDDNVAQKIKDNMFSFPDLAHLPDKDLEVILGEIGKVKTLAWALKRGNKELEDKIMGNISNRVKTILEDELANLPDQPKEEDIEAAEQAILSLARRLEQEGKIEKLVAKPAAKQSAE